MLLKIFKHDFKTCARYEVPILLALLGATVLGVVDLFLISLSVKDQISSDTIEGIGAVLGMMGLMFVIFLISAAASVMMFMIYYRFYKSMITDEAYLTLTLPVKPSSLITGKLLSALVWYVISIAAIVASFVIIVTSGGLMFAEGLEGIAEFFAELGYAFGDLIEILELGSGSAVLFAATMVVGAVSGLLQIFFSILFAGSIVKKYKALCAVGMVLGINFVVSSISQTILSVANISSSFILEMSFGSFMNLQLGVQLVIQIALGVAFYFLSCHLVKHKVNLE